MSEIVSKWVLHRLGMVMDMTPENFAVKTSNGLLLAQLLQSYEIITTEELNLIKDTDHTRECYNNFYLINMWLERINLTLSDEDLYETVHGVGFTSLHLFYQVFLELKDKTKLDFLTENELSAQLRHRPNRFCVKAIDESSEKFNLHKEGLCEPFLEGGDVYHWYKDRMDTLQNRCKDARDEYIHTVKNRGKSFPINRATHGEESGFVLARGLCFNPKPSNLDLTYVQTYQDINSLDERTYDDLINEQKQAQELPPFVPCPKEAKKIMKNLHVKSKVRLENKIMKNQLHQEIMNEFDRKINDNKAKAEDRVLFNIFMRQSLYEKELVSKLGQVKMQKDHMLENKHKQSEIFNKLKEKEFMETIMLNDKELNEKKLTYYLERERVLQLHKKIYEERLRLRAKKLEDLCSSTVRNMVDISMKIAEFKKLFGREPNKREMEAIKHLFLSGQPAFDICDPVINIMKDTGEEIPEMIVTKELIRQNAIDQEEFDAYMEYEPPWELKNISTSSNEVCQQISCGLNVLGQIVHKALQTKHPIIPLWEKPDFPDAAIRVCINGLNDLSLLPSLRNLLSERDIKVIELTQVVDFCIEAYHQQSKREYKDDDIVPVKESQPKKEKPPKPTKGERPNKKKKSVVEDTFDNTLMGPIKSTENKLVQTPIKYPCEEIPYTLHAILGRTAQELLDEGRALGDFLLIDMFVEYLKSIPNLKGWVLVNYPTTYEQAAILEEALSGSKLLDPFAKTDAQVSFADIIEGEQTDHCSLYYNVEGKRISSLLPNPMVPEPAKVYDTVLTAYIKLKKLAYDDKSGDAMLPPVYEELGEEPDPLDRFYSNAGANYSMYYKECDSTTVKYLGKLVIGDYSLPLKSSLELFGEVNNMDRRLSKGVKSAKIGDKLKKPMQRMPQSAADDKTSMKVVAGKKDKKGKTQVMIVYEDKGVQVPTEDEEEIEVIDLSSATLELPTAGQPGWEYSNVEGPEELLCALATLWEAVEDVYINDLKQIFFLKRLNMDSIMPFAQYVKDAMRKTINRPDYKGFYLSKFQKAFNTFHMDFRKDDDFKMEMHCRIEDFKEKLSEMCDMKMIESENLRCRIINADWAPHQITELVNNYINMIQIEIDRFIESMHFINDYYVGVTSELPVEEDNYKEDALPKYREISSDIINAMFQDSTSSVNLTYFDELLTFVIQKTNNCIKKMNAFATSSMEKSKSSQASNQKLKSKASSPKSKASKDTKKTVDPDTAGMKENYDKQLEEWQCAVKGETLRISLRIDLLKYNALQSVEEFLTALQQSFHDVYKEIRSKYYSEMENVEKACKVFKCAVENEVPVQKELLFEGHTFCINPDVNLFDNPPIIPELSEEVVEQSAFTIAQLSKLTDILLDLNPSGYIPKATFLFIMQDIIGIAPEDGSEWLAPIFWRKLNSASLKKVVDLLYDDLEYLYWRDFIIYNIRIKYPTERELLVTRRALRECDPDGTELIQNYQFFATKLWFEFAFKQEDSKRIIDIKQLLFKLYNIKNYGLNYTSLLLDFCKDQNSVEGFAKALELSIGKIVCWDTDIGNIFQEEYLRRMQQHVENVKERDDEMAEYYKAVYEEVSKLVDYVVHICEDIIIEDIPAETDADKVVDSKRGSILKKSRDRIPSVKKNSKVEELIRFADGEGAETVRESLEGLKVEQMNSLNMERSNSQIVKLYQDLPDNVETETSEFTEVLFFLSLDVLITVITAALPWHSRVQNIGDLSYWETAAQIFEKCKNPDFNMSVLTHEFLNSDMFLDLLALTKKFKIIDPVRVVNDVLNESEFKD